MLFECLIKRESWFIIWSQIKSNNKKPETLSFIHSFLSNFPQQLVYWNFQTNCCTAELFSCINVALINYINLLLVFLLIDMIQSRNNNYNYQNVPAVAVRKNLDYFPLKQIILTGPRSDYWSSRFWPFIKKKIYISI